jgi:hypothetical protein
MARFPAHPSRRARARRHRRTAGPAPHGIRSGLRKRRPVAAGESTTANEVNAPIRAIRTAAATNGRVQADSVIGITAGGQRRFKRDAAQRPAGCGASAAAGCTAAGGFAASGASR